MKSLEIGSTIPRGVIPEPTLPQTINWEYAIIGVAVLLLLLLIINNYENRNSTKRVEQLT